MSEETLADLAIQTSDELTAARRAFKNRLREAGGCNSLVEEMECDYFIQCLISASVTASIHALIHHLEQVQNEQHSQTDSRN